MDHKEYLSQIGRIGGSNGRGAAKRRTKAQCRKAALAKWAKFRASKESKK